MMSVTGMIPGTRGTRIAGGVVETTPRCQAAMQELSMAIEALHAQTNRVEERFSAVLVIPDVLPTQTAPRREQGEPVPGGLLADEILSAASRLRNAVDRLVSLYDRCEL